MWDINMQGYIAQSTEQLYIWKINLLWKFDQKLCALKAEVDILGPKLTVEAEGIG